MLAGRDHQHHECDHGPHGPDEPVLDLDRCDDSGERSDGQPPSNEVHVGGAVGPEAHDTDEDDQQVELEPESIAPGPVVAGDVLMHESLYFWGVEPSPELPLLVGGQRCAEGLGVHRAETIEELLVGLAGVE